MVAASRITDRKSVVAAFAATQYDKVTEIFNMNYAFLFLGYRNETYLWELVCVKNYSKQQLNLIVRIPPMLR